MVSIVSQIPKSLTTCKSKLVCSIPKRKKTISRSYALDTNNELKLFKANIQNAKNSVENYVITIKHADIKKINYNCINQFTMTPTLLKTCAYFPSIAAFFCISTSFEHRAVLASAFTHPKTFARYGKIDDWNDKSKIKSLLFQNKPLYDYYGMYTLKTNVAHSLKFIEKIQEENLQQFSVTDRIKDYEKFMTLVKLYGDKHRLIPPLEVCIIWHTHMLQHSDYKKSTTNYLGYILDNPKYPISPEQEKNDFEFTMQMWEKHFGCYKESSSTKLVDLKKSLGNKL